MKELVGVVMTVFACRVVLAAEDFPKPYSPPCTERENVFEFTEKPKVKNLGNDKYEITFAVKGNCDVTVGIVDENPSTGSTGSPQAGSRLREDATAGTAGRGGAVVRHLGSGVLGANAPAPFQRNSLKQTIYWNGKDDLDDYHKTPEKLKVRVMLGLKPEFDKRLGGTSPRNLPGYVWSIAVGPEGVYVFPKGQGAHGMVYIRKFDHDGNYIASLVPPPANLPEAKLAGMGYVEYEQGIRAIQSPNLGEVARNGCILPAINGKTVLGCQVALVNGKLYFCSAGPGSQAGTVTPSTLHYVYTDGSTDLKGMRGMPLAGSEHLQPRFASSPDGQWLYMTGGGNAVLRRSVEAAEAAKEWVGKGNTPGAGDSQLSQPVGLDCDAQGRVYVCDSVNNRIQVFSPEGKLQKSIPCDRPSLVRVHQKTGALYVKHAARVQGETVDRLSKLTSLETPNEEFHLDGVPAVLMSVDSWTPKPRLWLAGSGWHTGGAVGSYGSGPGVRVWEEDGKTLKKILDFEEEAKKEAGKSYVGTWSGIGAVREHVVCDPTREVLYFTNVFSFDLRTGNYLRRITLPPDGWIGGDDIAFDKRGYMHVHFNTGFYQQGVGRLDPSRPGRGPSEVSYLECPYDYGEEGKGAWRGILPVRDQPGAKYFQDGIGVNMRGDIAEVCNIYHVPKMEDVGLDLGSAGGIEAGKRGEWGRGRDDAKYKGWIDAQERAGAQVYSIRRSPGVPPAGGTIWTFDRNGELRDECAVTAGNLVNGPMIDEDGCLYFANNRTRLIGGKQFLAGKGGIVGAGKDSATKDVFTGAVIKTGRKATILSTSAPLPLDQRPERPAELGQYRENAWCEGAEWLYAGASPIVQGGCSCPTQRLHLDWYKRVYVPEAYRHSIGILDTNGNLIMHLGRYANFDSIDGPKSRIPLGGDGIGCFMPRFLSGTDNYFAYEFRGEALIVLKLNYHAEETVGIGEVMSGK